MGGWLNYNDEFNGGRSQFGLHPGTRTGGCLLVPDGDYNGSKYGEKGNACFDKLNEVMNSGKYISPILAYPFDTSSGYLVLEDQPVGVLTVHD